MSKINFFFTFFILFALVSCHQEGGLYYVDAYDFSSGGDQYNEQTENPFIEVLEQDVSTFSIDADGASYANIRRFIQDGELPPTGAIRTEELLNYFDLDYDNNTEDAISLNGEVSHCPWNTGNKLIRIGIKGRDLVSSERPSSNFIFLIDVSGSMSSEDKLDLLKSGFNLFVDGMDENDKVAIVTYAGSAGLVLESTSGNEKQKIKDAINSLGSGGSTAGAEGIITAYDIAQTNFITNGNNRIIIGTDGDFNVGPSSHEELVDLIEEKRDLGIYITVLGVGRGNLNDAALEQIADNGNGTYEYIDNLKQLKKVFIYDYDKFYTVAKDVKVQVTFNPDVVQSYRLIGYENRLLAEEDFEDDTKDAGEIGANQNITALYEIIPKEDANYTDFSSFTIDFRYKKPNEDQSSSLDLEIYDEGNTFEQSSDFMKFTASIASFTMLLRDSEYKGSSQYENVKSWLNDVHLNDEYGFKAEFKDLVEQAEEL